MTYTVPATVSTGGTSTAAQFTAAQASVAAIASRAEMSYVSPAGYTLAASTTAKIIGMTEVSDSPDTMLDLVNQRIVFRQAGKYRVRLFSIGITALTWTQLVRKNGTGSLMSQAYPFGLNYELDWSFPFIVGDYIEAWYTNSNGSSILLTDASVLTSPYPDGTVFGLKAEWVSP